MDSVASITIENWRVRRSYDAKRNPSIWWSGNECTWESGPSIMHHRALGTWTCHHMNYTLIVIHNSHRRECLTNC